MDISAIRGFALFGCILITAGVSHFATRAALQDLPLGFGWGAAFVVAVGVFIALAAVLILLED